jgi:hypothetical protein
MPLDAEMAMPKRSKWMPEILPEPASSMPAER